VLAHIAYGAINKRWPNLEMAVISLSVACALQAIVMGVLGYFAGRVWVDNQRQQREFWRRQWKVQRDVEKLDEVQDNLLERLFAEGEKK
jgi:hypothetical protein